MYPLQRRCLEHLAMTELKPFDLFLKGLHPGLGLLKSLSDCLSTTPLRDVFDDISETTSFCNKLV